MNLETFVRTSGDEWHVYPRLAVWLGQVVNGCVYVAAALVPLFFLPLTLDFLEIGKQTLLAALVIIGVLAWMGQAMCLRRVTISRSWVHLVVLVFAMGYAITSLFSGDRYLSFLGSAGQIAWSFLSMVSFVLLYFLIVNTVKKTTDVYHLVLAYLASSVVAAVIGLVHVLGWDLLGGLVHSQGLSFNTIGTPDAFAVYMTIPLILAASLTVLGCKDEMCILGGTEHKSRAAKLLVWASLLLALIVVIVVDYWVAWVAILFGTALLVGVPLARRQHVNHPVKIVVPAVLVVLSVLLLLFRTPFHANVPAEVAPSLSASLSIARQTLQQHPLFGSGPGTWLFDYAQFRSPSVNLSQFWTVRFDRSLTTFLTLLATIGLVGTALWLILAISGIAKSVSHLVLERNDDAWQAYLTLFTGWAAIVLLAFFYNYSFTHHFVFWFLLALLAALVSRGSLSWNVRTSILHSSILSFVFLIVMVGGVSSLWLLAQRLTADVVYAQAVYGHRAGQPVERSIKQIERARRLNRLVDTYERNLSQAYLIQASNEMQAAPDAERAKHINTFISSAVTSAKHATEMSPNNVDSWANFAVVLRSIAPFTRGADEQAIKMFQEASMREPNNPAFLNEIAKLDILRADGYRQLLQSTDDQVRKDADQHIKEELEKAADALNQSIQMKPDFAQAHYNLGLVYERQGRIKDAVLKLEEVLRSNERDVGIAFQLAILYYRNNEKDKTLNILEQIVAFDSSYANARWYLSVLYEEQGRYDDAIAQVKKVAEQYPDNQTVTDRMNQLIQARNIKAQPPVTLSPLPEPVHEDIKSQNDGGAVKKN